MSAKGVFCISLDFEKFWGLHDVISIEQADHLRQVDFVVDRLLKLFLRYDTHVTWAFVGMLAFKDFDHLKNSNSEFEIPYQNPNYSPFPLRTEKYGDFDPNLLFALASLNAIQAVPHQELSSHTFSHFYTMENGIGTNEFRTDLALMQAVEESFNEPLKTIVFPRNQINNEILALLAKENYIAFRGNQINRYWSNSAFDKESGLKKMMRVLDAYLPVSRTKSFKRDELPRMNGLLNIPANRFLRPPTSYNQLEKRKVKRVKNEMLKAAKKGWVYHLWWHPHNFAKQPEIALKQLEEILAYYHVLKQKFNFENLNMKEIAAND